MDSNGLRFWMLSQLNDWLPPWSGVTAYLTGQGIVDPNGNIQVAQNAGTSDAAQPTWSTVLSETTVDAGIVWINSGPVSWQPNAAYAVGQYILDSNGNLQCVSAIASNGTTGGSPPAWPMALGQTVVDGNVTWSCAGPSQSGLFFCSQTNRLQLRSMRTGGPFTENFNTATTLVNTTPMALDTLGNYARWDSSSGFVMAGGSGPSDAPPPNEVVIYAPGPVQVTDLVMGYDGVLYLAVGGSLVMMDRRNRWPNLPSRWGGPLRGPRSFRLSRRCRWARRGKSSGRCRKPESKPPSFPIPCFLLPAAPWRILTGRTASSSERGRTTPCC